MKAANLTLNVTKEQAEWLLNTLMFYEQQASSMREDTKDPILLNTMEKMEGMFSKEMTPIMEKLISFLESTAVNSK